MTISINDFGACPNADAADNDQAFADAIAVAASLVNVSPPSGAMLTLNHGAYEISQPITITDRYIGIRGDAAMMTAIYSKTNLHDYLVFDGTNGFILGNEIRDLNLDWRGSSERTGGWAIKVINCREPVVTNVNIENCFSGIQLKACNRGRIFGNHIDVSGRTTTTGGGIGIEQSGLASATWGQNHIYGNEIRAGGDDGEARLDAGLLITGADGCYFSHNHILGCVDDVRIAPDGTTKNDFIGGVTIADNYFDKCTEANVRITGTANTYQDIILSSNYYRKSGAIGSSGGHGIILDPASGVRNVQVNDGIVEDCYRTGVFVANGNVSNLQINGTLFEGNNGVGDQAGDILLDGDNVQVSDTMHVGGDTSEAGAFAIKLASNLTNAVINGSNLLKSTYQQGIIDLTSGNGVYIRGIVEDTSASIIEHTASVQTTDDTSTTLWEYTLSSNEVAHVEAEVVTARDTYAKASAYRLSQVVRLKDNSTTAVLIDNASAEVNPEIAGKESTNTTARIDVSGKNVQVLVTGTNDATYDWFGKIKVTRLRQQ